MKKKKKVYIRWGEKGKRRNTWSILVYYNLVLIRPQSGDIQWYIYRFFWNVKFPIYYYAPCWFWSKAFMWLAFFI
jgi:hypothetical protein